MKNFFTLKLVQSFPSIEEVVEYSKDLEQANRLGLSSVPEVPDSLKLEVSERNFRSEHYEILSWSSIWDHKLEMPLIILDIYCTLTKQLETVNAQYSKKEWIEIIKSLGYNYE